jgi:hypothetical protein
MKWFVIWMGVGAAFQLGVWTYARVQLGRYASDVGMRHALGNGRLLPMAIRLLVATVTWPIGLFITLHPQIRRRLTERTVASIGSELDGRCRDCGEPLCEAHVHDEPPLS